jgi:hypothetical protein
MVRFFAPDEDANLERAAAARRRYEMYRATAQPQTAQAVSSLAATYPGMRADVALPLAKSGHGADSPVAKRLAEIEDEQGFGFGWAVGKVTGAIGRAKDEAYGAVKGVLRGAMMGLDAAPQTFQGAFRESVADGDIRGSEWLLGAPNLLKGFQQTDLAAGHREIQREGGYAGLVTGSTDVDFGSGFFAGGDVADDAVARRRAAAPLTSDGKAQSIGRYTARQVFEPGSKPYGLLSGLVDGGVLLGADPANFLSKPISGAIRASKLIGPGGGEMKAVAPLRATDSDRFAAGLVDGIRKTILPEQAANYLNSRKGVAVRQWLVAETSFENMRQILGKNVDVSLIPRLMDAKTDAEVLDVIMPALEANQWREKVGVPTSMLREAQGDPVGIARASVVRAKESVRSYRWTQKMASAVSNLDEPNGLVEDMYRYGRNALMDDDAISQFTEQAARATDRPGRLKAADNMLEHIEKVVLRERAEKAGRQFGPAEQQVAAALTRWRRNYHEELTAYATDDIGQNAKVPSAIVNGSEVAVPTPHYVVETINEQFHWPDARKMRQATSGLMDMLDKVPAHLGVNTFTNGTALADFVSTEIFKVGALFRAAYPLRVLGEEQARLPGAGLTSLYTHPIRHIQAIVAHQKGEITDLLGNPTKALEEQIDALSRNANINPREPGVVQAQGRVSYARGQEGHVEALLDEMVKGNRDPVMRRVMNGLGEGDRHPGTHLGGLDAVKDWFFDGTGREFRNLLGHGPDRAGAVPRAEWTSRKVNPEDPLHSADGYIDSLAQRWTDVTKGDAKLREVMATGEIDGVPLSLVGKGGKRIANPKAVRALREYLEVNPQAGADKVWGDIFLTGKETPGSTLGAKYKSATNFFFDKGMGIPTDVLSRSQAWDQLYWKRQSELFSYMDPQIQKAALEMARKNKLVSQRYLKTMEKHLAEGRSGKLDAREADLLSKAFATDEAKKLMYDLSERGQFMDIYRNFFPFGEAWKEVMTTWVRIAGENPVVLRRGAQLVQAGRSGDADGDGEGFFHTDAQTGEEVFSFPFSGKLNKALTGVEATITAPVTGLNLFSQSILPGFGPIGSIPTAAILPDKPDFDGVREMLLPFGEKDMSGGALESFLPAWVQKARVWLDKDSPEQDKQFVKTVHDTMRYLVSTGEYSIDSPEEQERTLKAAKKAARRIYGVRALAQFWAPSPPSPKFVALDSDGNAVLAIRMVEEFRKMQAEDYTTATARFIEKFGEGALLTTISKTEGGSDPSDVAYDFVRRNPGVVERHKDVYGYFLPQQEEFSMKSYSYQQRSGQRKPRTPEEAIEIANQRLGAMIYRQARTLVGDRPAPEQQLGLRVLYDALVKEYPGYDSMPGNLREQRVLISKMVSAADDPVLSQTDAGLGLRKYLTFREQALEAARQRGRAGFTDSDDTADLREALRAVAGQIGTQHPGFADLFTRTFNREMKADEGMAA